jgi:hypothetical protein
MFFEWKYGKNKDCKLGFIEIPYSLPIKENQVFLLKIIFLPTLRS